MYLTSATENISALVRADGTRNALPSQIPTVVRYFDMTESSDKLKEVIENLKKLLEDSYLLILNVDELLKEYDKLFSKINSEFSDIFKAFKDNILSIVSVAKIPVQMSFERSLKLMYDDIYRRENILSLKHLVVANEEEARNAPTEEELSEKAKEITSKEFNGKIKTIQGNREFWYHTLCFIYDCANNALTSDNFLKSSKELINQTCLLTWSALEVLLRDYFILYLNLNPGAVAELAKDSSLKAKFDTKSIPTEKLIENNFDLSKCMGNILIENFDFSNVDVSKSVFKSVLNDESLNISLKDNQLWKLFQRRNLIVHRGGIIDDKYLSKTDDKLEIGKKLYIKPEELRDYLTKTIDVANALMKKTMT